MARSIPTPRPRSVEEICALDLPGYALGGYSVGESPVQMHASLPEVVGEVYRATGNVVLIEQYLSGRYWSEDDQAPHGSQLQGTILVELGPLPAQRCSGPQSCGFITDAPDPANRVTIAIP